MAASRRIAMPVATTCLIAGVGSVRAQERVTLSHAGLVQDGFLRDLERSGIIGTLFARYGLAP